MHQVQLLKAYQSGKNGLPWLPITHFCNNEGGDLADCIFGRHQQYEGWWGGDDAYYSKEEPRMMY